jgi:hypothetical protein
MSKHTQIYTFLIITVLLLLIAPYFLLSYAQDASVSATGCFILNQDNLPSGTLLPAGCDNGGGNQSVVKLARTLINKPNITYILGAPSDDWAADKAPQYHFDCSGFVGWAWYWGTNGKVSLPRTTSDAWDNAASYKLQKFLPSQKSQLEPGDLLYWSGADSPKPGHVTMYEGSGNCGTNDCMMEFYETPKPGKDDSFAAHLKYDTFYGFLRPMVQ